MVIGLKEGMSAQDTQEKFNQLFDKKIRQTEQLAQDLGSDGLLNGMAVDIAPNQIHFFVEGSREQIETLMSVINSRYPDLKYIKSWNSVTPSF